MVRANLGSDQINPLNYQEKSPIPCKYSGLNGPFRGQNGRYKAVEHPEAAVVHHPIRSSCQWPGYPIHPGLLLQTPHPPTARLSVHRSSLKGSALFNFSFD